MRKAIGLAAVLLTAACGGSDSGGGGGGGTTTVHCLFAGDMCDQITGVISSAQQASLSTSCTTGGGGGTFAVGTCSTAGAVAGHCHYVGATVTSMTGVDIPGAVADEYYYTAGAWTLTDAQTWCATAPAGTWVP